MVCFLPVHFSQIFGDRSFSYAVVSSGVFLEIIASTRKFVSSGGALGNELADLLGETEYIRGSSKYNQVNPLIIFNHSVFVDIF